MGDFRDLNSRLRGVRRYDLPARLPVLRTLAPNEAAR